jgi:hypothetical protein
MKNNNSIEINSSLMKSNFHSNMNSSEPLEAEPLGLPLLTINITTAIEKDEFECLS